MPKLPRTAHPPAVRRRRAPSRIAAVLGAMLLFAGSIAAVLAQGFGPAGPSPAGGHASVVAHGVVSFDEGNGRWHINEHTAETGSAPLDISVPGFIIAQGTPILITNTTTLERVRLASGETTMVRPGDRIVVETFGAPDTFLLAQLAIGDQQPLDGSARGVYTSASFPVTSGDRDMDLLRDVIAEGEATVIPGGAIPTAVYVYRGEVAIASANDETTLGADEAGVFTGDFQIQAIADGSIVYAAYVGASVPATESSPEATPPPATPEAATPEPASPVPATPVASPAPATPLPNVEPTPTPTSIPDSADDDGDGLVNDIELLLGTDPQNPDTDDDGINDGQEAIVLLTDPLNPDTDGDTLYDGGELIYRTDPLNPDTDGDTFSDGDEIYVYGTDPLNPQSHP